VIYDNKIYESRPTAQYLEDWTYPPGIEQLVDARRNRKEWPKKLRGLFLIKDGNAGAGVIADVLAAFADHADLAISFPVLPALHSMRGDSVHLQSTGESVLQLLTAADILGIYRIDKRDEKELRDIDHEMAGRGDLKKKVTILVGSQVGELTLTKEAYGKDVSEC